MATASALKMFAE